MKIAYIALKGMPLGGGIEKYTEEVGSRLAKQGHEVIVYTMRHYGAKDGFYKGMKITTMPCIKNRVAEKLSISMMATIDQCFKKNVDIIHFHHCGPALFAFIPKISGQKVVTQAHGLDWKRTKWGIVGQSFLRLIEPSLVLFTDCLTVVSKVQRDYFMKKYYKHSVYIPTGVNVPQIEKPDLIQKYGLNGNDYILFASRLVHEKGAHYLIKAYNKLDTKLKLVIAGDAPYEEVYKADLKELSKENKNIIFTGFVTGKFLHELFSNAYFFVLPSVIEGLSTVLLESMSYGNCCLVSDIPENLEALNGIGYTFISNNVNHLLDRLQYLINNPCDVEIVKVKAKQYVIENYSWDEIAYKFNKLYQDVLNNSLKI